jgi:predicted DNA-binding transcriptional regulator YafY
MNRIDRLTGTLWLLQTKRSASALDLANHWEVSLRTIYRDLASLCEAGVPICHDPVTGVYRLMPGSHVPPLMFSDEEACALFLSARISEHLADPSLKQALRCATAKIRSVLPDTLARQASEVGKDLLLQFPHETQAHPCPPAGLIELQQAILDRRSLLLFYDTAGKGQPNERKVNPIGLLHYAGYWHLYAYCHLRREHRDFRIDRILSCQKLDEHFEIPEGLSLESRMRHSIQEKELTPVRLKVSPRALPKLLHCLSWMDSSQQALSDGHVELCFGSDAPLGWTAQWLFHYGTEVEVLSPDALRAALAQTAKDLMEHHLRHP